MEDISMHKMDYNKLDNNSYINKENTASVISIVDNILDKVCNEEMISDGTLSIHDYSSVLLFLAEISDCFLDKAYYQELVHKYLIKIKSMIEKSENRISMGLFGGLTDVGFAVYHINKIGFKYNKFQASINNFIIKYVYELINYIKVNQGKVHPSSYDAISGLSGIVSYLLFFKDDIYYVQVIKDITNALISITEYVELNEDFFPGWYVTKENMFLDSEREYYTEGLFNYGLSHGASGILAALSLILINKIEVDGQREAIARLLDEYKRTQFKQKSGYSYWPEKIRKQEYKSKCYTKARTRASWCYGTPGIARSIYLGGKSISDQESISIAMNAFNDLCMMQDEDYMLISPIICHGYAGIVVSIDAMYLDTKESFLNIGRKKIFEQILKFYDIEAKYGFIHFEHNKFNLEKSNFIRKIDSLSLIEGNIGIILSLLLILRSSKTNWQRHILIN